MMTTNEDESSTTADALHYLGKGHGFVYAGNGEREILHHGSHHAVLIRCDKTKAVRE